MQILADIIDHISTETANFLDKREILFTDHHQAMIKATDDAISFSGSDQTSSISKQTSSDTHSNQYFPSVSDMASVSTSSNQTITYPSQNQ